MPLRDHFRPPVWNLASWEGFHGMWPASMVIQLTSCLPEGYSAEPRVHLGTFFEIDVCAFEDDKPKWRPSKFPSPGMNSGNGAVATATWAPPNPTLDIETDLTEQYEYEVLIYDHLRGRELVAAIEIVSPANKDRPENREAFVAKCAALLQKRVCVSIVDLVTTRHFNLYSDLLKLTHRVDPAFEPEPPATYAATCRGIKVNSKPRLQTWAYPLVVGQPLPKLPIWLTEVDAVSLDLEASYEDACRALRIP